MKRKAIIIGIRGYSKDVNGKHAYFDVYANDTPKNIEKAFKVKADDEGIENAEKTLIKIVTR